MGRYFRAPRKADATQWRKVEMLYRAGVYFGGTQSPELGKFPETLLEASAFIARNKAVLSERARRRDRSRAAEIAILENILEKKEAKRREVRLKAKLK